MFRPIRKDTPKGKAAQTLQLGKLCVFVFTPGNAMIYLLSGLTQQEGVRPLLDDPGSAFPVMVLVPSITLLIGLMLMYDGWWNMRRLS